MTGDGYNGDLIVQGFETFLSKALLFSTLCLKYCILRNFNRYLWLAGSGKGIPFYCL